MSCRVAEQATQILDDFDEAHQNSSTASEETYEATIPYFGKLHIVRKRSTTKPTMQLGAPELTQNGLTSDPSIAPFISFEDYLQWPPEIFQPGRGSTLSWMSHLAVEDNWMWTPNGTEMQ